MAPIPQNSDRPPPVASTFGLLLLALAIASGLSVHQEGYGAGGGGAVQMLQGIGIGLLGCGASFACGIVSISRAEKFWGLSLLALFLPVIIVVLCAARVIPL